MEKAPEEDYFDIPDDIRRAQNAMGQSMMGVSGQFKDLMENTCQTHNDPFILYCLKCQQKVCQKCLNTTHLFHPVVPLNSLDNLDFTETLNQEIESSIDEITKKTHLLNEEIMKQLRE